MLNPDSEFYSQENNDFVKLASISILVEAMVSKPEQK